MRIKETIPKYAMMELSAFKTTYFAGPRTLANFLVSDLKDIIRLLRTVPEYAHMTLTGNKPDLVQKLAAVCFHKNTTAAAAPAAPGVVTGATTTTTTITAAYRGSPRSSHTMALAPGVVTAATTAPHRTSPRPSHTAAPYTTTTSQLPSTQHRRQRTSLYSSIPPPLPPLSSVQSQPPSSRFGEMADLSSLTPTATTPPPQQQQQFPDVGTPTYSYAQLAQQAQAHTFSQQNMTSLLRGLANRNTTVLPDGSIFATSTDRLQNPSVPVEVIKPAGKTSGALRKETDEEIHIRAKIEGDRTLRGYQNPYYEIVTVLDVKKISGAPHSSWEFAVNARDLQKMKMKKQSSRLVYRCYSLLYYILVPDLFLLPCKSSID